MGINLDAMKKKLSQLDSKGSGDNKFWKPTLGDHDVRLLCPSDGDPFREYHFHYLKVNGKNRSILCPNRNFGDDCPICQFASSLWRDAKDAGDKQMMNQAKDLFVKQRYFSPVVVRGLEQDGVKIWGYPVTSYRKLISYVLNPDYGDITDIENGTDITVKCVKIPGKKYNGTELEARRRTTPLCSDVLEDGEECSKLLNQLEDIDFGNIFKRASTQEAKNLLDESLANENTTGEEKMHYNAPDTVSEIDQAYKELMNN